MRNLYTGILCASLGLASLLGGCGGGRNVDPVKVGKRMSHKLDSEARQMLDNIIYFRDQHGYTQCRSQELSAILNAASAKDGDPNNTITKEDLMEFYKQAVQQGEALYSGKLPGVKGSAGSLP